VFPKLFLSWAHFGFEKIANYPHVRVEHPDDGNSKFKIYISKLILDSYEYMPEAYIITRCEI
jgi:hypothetical protein